MTYNATAPVSPSRAYQYDTLGRPTSRTLARQGTTRNDVFTYNDRSELISDVVDGTGLNGWDYDRAVAPPLQAALAWQAAASSSGVASNKKAYANQLNQYTAIEDESHDVFTPTYDDDGNQTRIKTSTGIWNVAYNAKNRPILFTKDDNSVSVACTYDYMGRRATKVVTENGVVTTSHRFLYRGYLQVACCDRKRANHPCLWLITWDPTQPIATRPLAIQKDGTWYTYGWDLSKNVWEVYGTTGYIGTAYTYTAYGQVTASASITRPIQWSSEYNDTELALVYYNYRHYNSIDGRWIGRDLVEEIEVHDLYSYIANRTILLTDSLGLIKFAEDIITGWVYTDVQVAEFNATTFSKTEKNYSNRIKENIDIGSMLESEIGLTAQYKGVSFQTTVRTRYTQNRKIEIPCCSGIRFRYDFKCSSKMTNFLFWLVGFDFSIYKYKMTCECTSITMEDVDVSKDCPNCVPYQNKL